MIRFMLIAYRACDGKITQFTCPVTTQQQAEAERNDLLKNGYYSRVEIWERVL